MFLKISFKLTITWKVTNISQYTYVLSEHQLNMCDVMYQVHAVGGHAFRPKDTTTGIKF